MLLCNQLRMSLDLVTRFAGLAFDLIQVGSDSASNMTLKHCMKH